MVRARYFFCKRIVWLAVLLAPAACFGQTPGDRKAVSHTRLIILGTGNPVADPDRFGPASVVLVNDRPYLIDCGVGVGRRWAAAIRKYDISLKPWDLRTAFVTHLHTDHTLGYPELIFTSWTLGGENLSPLQMYGPKGLRWMTRNLIAAYRDDIRIRTGKGGELYGRRSPAVNVHEIAPGIIYKDDLVTVTAFSVPHGTWQHAFGFKFETPDKVIVFSGDTRYSPVIAKQCDGCDILVHEGGIADNLLDRAGGTPGRKYFLEFHTTAAELAKVANDAKPKLLVLYHQRNDNKAGLAIIRSLYKGKVVVASDLDIFE